MGDEDRSHDLHARVSVLESTNLLRRDEERDRALELREMLREIQRQIDDLYRVCRAMEDKLQPLYTAYEGEKVDRKEFWRMTAGAVLVAFMGLICTSLLTPLIQHWLLGAHP